MIQGADNVQALSKELKKSGRMHQGGIPRGRRGGRITMPKVRLGQSGFCAIC